MGIWAPCVNFPFPFVFSATLHSSSEPDTSKSRTFSDLSPHSKSLVFCCDRREEIPDFMMRRRAGGLIIISSEVSTSLLVVSPVPQPHSQRYLPAFSSSVCLGSLGMSLSLASGLGSFLMYTKLFSDHMLISFLSFQILVSLTCFFSFFPLYLFLYVYAFAFKKSVLLR